MPKKELTEFEIARKKRQKKIARQRLLRLLLIMIISAAIVAVIYLTVSEDLIGIISDRISISQSTATMPVGMNGKSVRDLFESNDNIAVLSDSTLYLYSEDGAKLLSYSHGMVNPKAKPSGRKILLYDQGGKKLIVRTRDKIELETAFDSGILYADINSKGDVTVVTMAQRYASEVHVFDPSYKEEIFTWSASDDYVVSASVSPGGRYMAAVSLSSNQFGEMTSCVRVFNLNNGEKTAEQVFDDASPINLSFDKDGNIKLLLDCEAVLLNTDLEILSSFYHTGTLISYSNPTGKNGMVLIYDRFMESRSTGICFLGKDFSDTKEINAEGKYSLSYPGDDIFTIYMDARIDIIDWSGSSPNGKIIESFEYLGDPLKIMTVGKNVYAVTRQELTAAVPPSEKETA